MARPAPERPYHLRPYRDVAERLDRWREAGQLLEDRQPAVYLHEYTADGLTVRGLIGALDLTRMAGGPDDARWSRTRESTPTKGQRPCRTNAPDCGLNPAPILLVHRGPVNVRELARTQLEDATRPDEFIDRADQRHRLWAIRDTGPASPTFDAALVGARPP